MYSLEVEDKADKKFFKLRKKNPKHLNIIKKKVRQILKNPHRFKPLSGVHHGEHRVHIASSFVLTYAVDEDEKVVRVLDFDHHDKIY